MDAPREYNASWAQAIVVSQSRKGQLLSIMVNGMIDAVITPEALSPLVGNVVGGLVGT